MWLDPVSAAAARWLARRMVVCLLVIAALFAMITLVPIQVYKAGCREGPRSIFGAPPRMDGPLRRPAGMQDRRAGPLETPPAPQRP